VHESESPVEISVCPYRRLVPQRQIRVAGSKKKSKTCMLCFVSSPMCGETSRVFLLLPFVAAVSILIAAALKSWVYELGRGLVATWR